MTAAKKSVALSNFTIYGKTFWLLNLKSRFVVTVAATAITLYWFKDAAVNWYAIYLDFNFSQRDFKTSLIADKSVSGLSMGGSLAPLSAVREERCYV